jgi:hypothetical protein
LTAGQEVADVRRRKQVVVIVAGVQVNPRLRFPVDRYRVASGVRFVFDLRRRIDPVGRGPCADDREFVGDLIESYCEKLRSVSDIFRLNAEICSADIG